MLPLHGQVTAAVKEFTGQNVPFIYFPRGNVFGKQSNIGVAEFLQLRFYG